MKTIYKAILLGCMFLGTQVFAQVFGNPEFEDDAYKAINHVYNLEFEKADALITQIQKRFPDHPAPHFMFAANRWWQTYISITTPKYYSYIEKQLELSIEKNEKYEDNPAYAHEYTYLQFMTYALKARYHSYRGEWYQAANSARKILSQLKKGFGYMDERSEFYFTSGIYHYYAETYPEDHVMIRPFMVFFPDGDAVKGLQELETAGKVRNFAQAEALYYLADIYMFEKNEFGKGVRIAKQLATKYPNNTWFRADYAHSLLLNKQYDAAGEILNSLVSAFERQSGHATENITSLRTVYTTHLMTRVYYIQGKLKYYAKNDFQGAKSLFEKSIKMASLTGIEDYHLLPADYYYIGRCYDGLGQREKAVEAYKKALKMDDNERIKPKAKACLKAPCATPGS